MISEYLEKRRNWLWVLVVALLWVLNFLQDIGGGMHPGIQAIFAAAFTVCYVLAFRLAVTYFPKIRKNRSAKARFILLAVLLVLGVFANEVLYYELDPFQQDEWDEYPEDDYEEGSFFLEAILSVIFSAISIGTALLAGWVYMLTTERRRNEIAISSLVAMNKEAELNELKNQFNPHFLFNALSSIYSMAYMKDPQTPQRVMQLSQMLRYVIYDTETTVVALEKELEYVKSFIAFQQLKVSQEQAVEFEYADCDLSVRIPPLTLLPFVENAFKHSQISVEKQGWIRMKLATDPSSVFFRVENTISDQAKPEILDNKGIGLENIRKRLALIYQDDFTLTTNSNGVYVAQLTIPVK